MGEIHRLEALYVLLVQTQESVARWEVIIDNIENFPIDPLDESSQYDRLRAVFDVGKRYGVRPTEMQEKSKRTDADAAWYCQGAVTINATRSNEHIGNAKILTILGNDLFLLDLSEAVSFSTKMWIF